MDKKLMEKMKLGNNDGLNSTLDIIKETYKNFQLVAPNSPHKKRKGILDSKNMKQKINLTFLNQQIEQITILFLQRAFSVIFMDHQQRDQINKLQEQILQHQQEEEYRKVEEKMRLKRNSINIQKIIRPSQLITTKVHKSIFNQNGDTSPQRSICSNNDSQDESDQSINNESADEIEENKQTIPQVQQKKSQMKRFANAVGRFIDTKRRDSWKQELISKLGINKQVEDKFERFMSKNFTKLQRQDTVQVKDNQAIKTQNNNQDNDDLTPVTRSRNISLDRLVVGRQNLRNHYEEFLTKDNVDISNYEDGWMIINILKKSKKSRNEKLFLKKSLQNINLFQKHKDAVFKNSQTNEKLFESLGYKFFKRNEVIFHIGSVVLLLPKSNEDAEQLEKEAEIRRRQNKKQIQNIQETKKKQQQQLLQQQQDKKLSIRDHIVKPRQSTLPLVFNLSQTSIQSQGSQNLSDKESIQDIYNQDSKQTDRDQLNISSSRKILFPQQNEENQEELNQLFQNSNRSSTQQRKSKVGEDKVSFFELARFLKVQESDFNFYVNKQFPLMKQIRIFGPGEAFGEIALLTKSRRTGTMVCKEDSHVMTLKKDGFDKIMGYYNNIIINERIAFFKQFEFMKGFSESKLMILLHETKIEYFTRNQIIYKEKDPIHSFYFIKEGIIEISEKVFINQDKYVNQNSQRDIQENQDQGPYDGQNIMDKFFIKTYLQQNKQKRLVVYNQSNMSFFGELELLYQNVTERFQQAMCTSIDCTVYSVKKELFIQLLKRFDGLKQLTQESQEKRNLQLQIIKQFQDKKTEKILRKNQIKYEREKRRQLISDQLNLKNKKSDSSDNLQKSPKNTQNSLLNNSQNVSSINIDQKKENNQNTNTKSYQRGSQKNISKINQIKNEMMEISKSYVGSKNIDDAIKKAFFTPSLNWVNPCYRSLDNSKYTNSNNILDQKLKNLTINENKVQYERPEHCILYDQIKRSQSSKNGSPNFIYSQCQNNRKSVFQISTQTNQFFQDQSRRSSKNSNISPMSNQSQTYYREARLDSKNSSLINFQDYVLNNQDSDSKYNTDSFSNYQEKKYISNTISAKDQNLSASYYYNINLRKENRKSKSTNIKYQGENVASQQQNSQKQINDVQSNPNSTKSFTPSASKNGFYQQKLGSMLFTESVSNSFQNLKNAKISQSSNSTKMQSQNGFPSKNLTNMTMTIRKESFTQNSFLQKQYDVWSTFYNKSDLENNMNLIQDSMFKTQKQLQQELQTQSQIKTAILGQFKNQNQQDNHSNSKQLVSLLYDDDDDPQKQKALQKAMLSKLIPFRKKTVEQKPKQFNKIHINIIEKLNLNS